MSANYVSQPIPDSMTMMMTDHHHRPQTVMNGQSNNVPPAPPPKDVYGVATSKNAWIASPPLFYDFVTRLPTGQYDKCP